MSNSQPQEKKKKQAQKPRKVTVAVQKANGKLGLAYHVPKCVRHYLEASINPFETPEGACLPADLFPLPSFKRVIYCKGSMATGTTGYGFISMTPVAASDVATINTTTSTSVMTATTVISSVTFLSGANFSNSPYAAAAFGNNGILMRSVAYGIRIRCTSSMMNRGGSYILFEHPQHQDATGLTFTLIKSFPGAQTLGIPQLIDPNQWDASVCTSGPTVPAELNYSSSGSGPLNGLSPLIICINSAVAGMTFDWECYHHVEFIGQQTTRTPSHSSPAGFSSAVQAMKEHTTSIGPVSTDFGPSILQRFASGIIEEMPRLIEIGAGVGRMLLGDEAGGIAHIANGGMNLITDVAHPRLMDSRNRDDHKPILVPRGPVIHEMD